VNRGQHDSFVCLCQLSGCVGSIGSIMGNGAMGTLIDRIRYMLRLGVNGHWGVLCESRMRMWSVSSVATVNTTHGTQCPRVFRVGVEGPLATNGSLGYGDLSCFSTRSLEIASDGDLSTDHHQGCGVSRRPV
jgi:hypothetical protein